MADNKPVVPVSAPKLKSLTPEERTARYAELRKRLGRSRIDVLQRDPDYYYYWARKDDTHEMSRLEYLGFEIVTKTNSPTIDANGLKHDGTFVLGDVILMRVDRVTADFLDEENARRGRELVEGAKRDFHADAHKEGIPTFERGEDPAKVTTVHRP